MKKPYSAKFLASGLLSQSIYQFRGDLAAEGLGAVLVECRHCMGHAWLCTCSTSLRSTK